MENQKSTELEGADNITLSLISYELGPIMTHKVYVNIYLDWYPERRVVFPMNLEYRECYAKDFKGTPIEKQRIPINENPFQIDLEFRQSPCQFT